MPLIRTSISEERRERRSNPLERFDNSQGKSLSQRHKPVMNLSLVNIGGDRYEGDVIIAGEPGCPGFDALFHQASHGASFDSAERYSAGKCLPGTRETIISAIRDWIRDPVPEHDILWLNGPAGVGKSSIAQTIASIVNDEEDKILAGSFFFCRGVVGREEASSLFPTLAYQIGVSMRGLRQHIDDAMKEDYSIPKKSIDKHFPHLIVKPLLKSKSTFDFSKWHRPTVVIDGLDECQDHKMQLEILSLIGKAYMQHDIPLRFLITSRPENWIRKAFDSEPLRHITNVMTIGSDEEADEDIRKYLLLHFDEIYSEKRDLMYAVKVMQPWPSPEIVEAIVRRASGQFVYASTLCKFLESRFCNPVKELQMIMKPNAPQVSAFSDLDSLYIHILSQFPREKTKILRNVLAGVVIDLPLRAIQIILHIEYDEIFLALDALRSVITIPDGYNGYVVDHKLLEAAFGPPDLFGAAKLCHASFREFLLDPNRSANFSVNLSKDRGLVVRNFFKIIGNALRGNYLDIKHPDMPFAMFIGTLTASFESCLGNRQEWYPPLVLKTLLNTFHGQLISLRSGDLVGIPEPIKLLHYLQTASEFLQDRLVDTHLDDETKSAIRSLIHDLMECMSQIVQTSLYLHRPHLFHSCSPLMHLGIKRPNVLLTLNDLSKMLNTPSSRIVQHLLDLQDLISCRHVVGSLRHYCLSLLAVISHAISEKQVMDGDDDDIDEHRRLTIHSVSQVLACLPNMNKGDYTDSPFDSSSVVRETLSSFYEDPFLSDIHSDDLDNKDFISVLNLTLDLPNRERNRWSNFEISASILTWQSRQYESADAMGLLKDFDPTLCEKMVDLPTHIYEEIILPIIANPYTAELRMFSPTKRKTILLRVIPINGLEHTLIEEESFVPAGTIMPPSFELWTDDYDIIISSLPQEIHAQVRTRFVEFVLHMWAKDVYRRSHRGFQEYSRAVDGLNLPCFNETLNDLLLLPVVQPTESILTAIRAIRCLVPDGNTIIPVDGAERLSILLRKYFKSRISEQELDGLCSWLTLMREFESLPCDSE